MICSQHLLLGQDRESVEVAVDPIVAPDLYALSYVAAAASLVAPSLAHPAIGLTDSVAQLPSAM